MQSATLIEKDQAKRNAAARAAFLQQYETLGAEQVHEMYGSKAKNRAALAARWRAQKKIFAVEHAGRMLYPAYQFDAHGHPKKAISDTLKALGSAVGGWQTALWFTMSNGWLAGRKPLDLLDRDPAAVIAAAKDISDPAIY